MNPGLGGHTMGEPHQRMQHEYRLKRTDPLGPGTDKMGGFSRKPIWKMSLVLALLVFGSVSLGSDADPQQSASVSPHIDASQAEQPVSPSEPRQESVPGTGASQVESGPGEPHVPTDPCLPSPYHDWRDFSRDHKDFAQRNGFKSVRVIIDRSTCTLELQGLRSDASTITVYATSVAIGNVSTPTPSGTFVINHLYCYPDVMFFGGEAQPVPGLYRGFFAPLHVCTEEGRCERYRDLGIHGFNAAAFPRENGISPETQGTVSGGCIRVPDPCRLKRELIRAVGLGPMRKNDRGCYHWLNRPVVVSVEGSYPGYDDTTILSLLHDGISSLHGGLRSFFGLFGP
jgi:hypothetical protein